MFSFGCPVCFFKPEKLTNFFESPFIALTIRFSFINVKHHLCILLTFFLDSLYNSSFLLIYLFCFCQFFTITFFPTHSDSRISCFFLESGFRLSSKKAQGQFVSLSFYSRGQQVIQAYPGVKLRHSFWRVSPQLGSGADFTVEFRTISLEEIFCTSGTDSPLISFAAVSARVSPKSL